MIAFLGAIVPAAAYVWIARSFDRYEKGRWWLLAMTFLWGAIPALWLAGICNRFFNGMMMYDTEAGLSTPQQASAALVILGVLTPLAEECSHSNRQSDAKSNQFWRQQRAVH